MISDRMVSIYPLLIMVAAASSVSAKWAELAGVSTTYHAGKYLMVWLVSSLMIQVSMVEEPLSAK